MTARNTPRGVIYRKRHDRPAAQHQFLVRDRLTKTYKRKSFSEYDEGLTWAKNTLDGFDTERETAARPMWAEIGAEYLERLEKGGATASYQDQMRDVLKQLHVLGVRDMSKPTFPALVQRWLDGMRSNKKDMNGKHMRATPHSLRRNLTMVRTLAHYAQDRRLLIHDPLRLIIIPKIPGFQKPLFSVPELRVLLSDFTRFPQRRERKEIESAIAATGSKEGAAQLLGVHLSTIYNRLNAKEEEDHWWLAFVLGLYTGCRPSEWQNLRWEWFSPQEDCLHLPPDAPGNKLRMHRVIPLQPELRDILMDHYRVGMSGHILPDMVSKQNKSDRAALFRKFLRRNGIDQAGRSPHALRHQHGALCVAMRMPHAQVMLNMGHSDFKISLHYARSAQRFRLDVRAWGPDRFFLRDEPPLIGLLPPSPAPELSMSDAG